MKDQGAIGRISAVRRELYLKRVFSARLFAPAFMRGGVAKNTSRAGFSPTSRPGFSHHKGSKG